ncbi:MAG: DUF456 domain-containing protein [Pirellulales bacterium]
MDILLALGMSLVAVCCSIVNLLGLPGNWVLAGVCAIVFFFAPVEFRSHIGWQVCAGVTVVAGIGELFELLAGAMGANRLGGSKRGTALALIGSIIGAIIGMIVGSPIPIVGNVVASLVGSGVGAFGGAVLGERWAGKDWEMSAMIGSAAFWGRILGTATKVACGAVAALIVLVAVWY